MRCGAAAALVFTLVVLSGCAECSFKEKKDILAKVNRHCVTKQELELKANLYSIEISDSKGAGRFLNLLVNDYLILDSARKDGISFTRAELEEEMQNFVPGFSPREIKKALKNSKISYRVWLRDIKEKIIRKKEINHVMRGKIELKEEEVKDYFWSNIIHFRRIHKVRAGQIVVEEEEKAREIRRQALDGADFKELAKKYSITSEAKKGGDLGYFGKRDMPAFITRVVFEMKKGRISSVIKSPYGYHIFKVEDVRLAETPKFEEVKDEVYEDYYEEKKDEYFNAWMEDLRKDADIKIFKENLEVFNKEETK